MCLSDRQLPYEIVLHPSRYGSRRHRWNYLHRRSITSRDFDFLGTAANRDHECAACAWHLNLKPLAHFELDARVLHCKFIDGSASRLVPVDLALGWGPMSDQRVARSTEDHAKHAILLVRIQNGRRPFRRRKSFRTAQLARDSIDPRNRIAMQIVARRCARAFDAAIWLKHGPRNGRVAEFAQSHRYWKRRLRVDMATELSILTEKEDKIDNRW